MKDVWFSRPGIASVFTPSAGMAQECRTSSEEISMRIGDSIGTTIRLPTSRSRKKPFSSSCVWII